MAVHRNIKIRIWFIIKFNRMRMKQLFTTVHNINSIFSRKQSYVMFNLIRFHKISLVESFENIMGRRFWCDPVRVWNIHPLSTSMTKNKQVGMQGNIHKKIIIFCQKFLPIPLPVVRNFCLEGHFLWQTSREI